MAPLQLRLEPTEVVLATDKGAARARVDSTNESSSQQCLFCGLTFTGGRPPGVWLGLVYWLGGKRLQSAQEAAPQQGRAHQYH
eukprot:scaffold584_cov121-Isochrysis_galbana.AAC.4